MTSNPTKGQRNRQRDLLATGNPLKRFIVRRQWIDWLLALIAGYAAHRYWNHHTLLDLDPTGRRSVYQTASAIATALFGLTMTSISILMSNLDKPLGGLPGGMPSGLIRALSRTMFGLMRASAALLLAGVTLLIIDTQPKEDGFSWTTALLAGLAVAIGARMLRVTYLLSRVLPARSTK